MFANAVFSPPSSSRRGQPLARRVVLGRPRQGLVGELQRGHQFEEHRHQVRVERPARLLPEQQQRQLAGHPLVVGTVARDRVEVVGHGQDAGAARDVLAAQAERVAGAVPALVVAEHQRRHGVRERDVLDDLEAHLRVDLHLPELLVGQRTGLREDVLGHGELADVVEHGGRRDALDLFVRARPRHGPAPVPATRRDGCGGWWSGPWRRSPAPAPRWWPGAGPKAAGRGWLPPRGTDRADGPPPTPPSAATARVPPSATWPRATHAVAMTVAASAAG